MEKKLHFDKAAEKEATDIGARFMHSSDVVGDMSRAYGRDLSSVRIHTDESAARGAAERGVDAFSTGKDVFFARGAFDRSDPASRGLLAHELSHSMQQGVGGEGGAMAQSAPMGAAQGGLLDWFRSKFGRKKKPEPEPELHISEPLAVERNTSAESNQYMQAMQEANTRSRNAYNISKTALPQMRQGARGGAETITALHNVMHSPSANNAAKLSPIQASNNNFLHAGKGEDPVAKGLVSLGLRSDGAEKRALDAARGGLFTNLKTDIADYADALGENADLGSILSGAQQYKYGIKPYSMSDELQQVASGMLNMFGQYTGTEEAAAYFRDAAGTMQEADVFQKGGKDVYEALVEDVLLRYGAVPSVVAARQAQNAQEGKAANPQKTMVMTKAAQALMHVPKMATLSPKEFAQMPPQMQALYAQYQSIVEQIKATIGG